MAAHLHPMTLNPQTHDHITRSLCRRSSILHSRSILASRTCYHRFERHICPMAKFYLTMERLNGKSRKERQVHRTIEKRLSQAGDWEGSERRRSDWPALIFWRTQDVRSFFVGCFIRR